MSEKENGIDRVEGGNGNSDSQKKLGTSKQVSGWVMPGGVALSVISNVYNLRPDSYNSVWVYAIAMADVLAVFVLYFLYRNEGKLARAFLGADHSIQFLERAALWAFAFGVFLFGWLIGDYISLVITK